jgi:hypothetical protein
MSAALWKSTRRATVQVIGMGKSQPPGIVAHRGFVAIHEIVAYERCPHCHASGIPIILNDGVEVIGVHRKFGSEHDCPGVLRSLQRAATPGPRKTKKAK